MYYKAVTFIITFFIAHVLVAQEAYPDVKFPSDTPLIFAENLLSDGLSNRDFTISPRGDEVFFTVQQPKFLLSTILTLKKKNGKWGSPEVASFSGVYRDLEATFSADGKTIYFSSDRPVDSKDSLNDFDIWKVTKDYNGNWGTPQHLGFAVNTEKNEFYPSVSKTGNLYFTVEADYGKGKEDIVMCRFNNGNYEKPISLPEAINSTNYEFNAFVDPDEKFILFTSYGRNDDMGGGDLYISKKDAHDNWLPAQHLPIEINSTGLDYCPFVSWDKKYFFFTSNRVSTKFKEREKKTYAEIKSLLLSTGNGLDDIYWVKADGLF